MMHSPLLFALGLVTSFASLSEAHTTFTTLFVDDVNQGDGTCIRMAKEGNLATHPIAGGLDAEDMACGRDGQNAVAFSCPAPAGAKLTLEFREWADAAQPGSIDPSHVGPMAIYLKHVSDMQSDPAAGEGWFKIWAEGFDTAAGKWATEKLIDNNGLLSINLPPGLPTGSYLARHEIITLQNVTNDKTDAQFYVGCAQLAVEGGTSDSPIPSDKTVSIPGHISDPADPGLTFNVYTEDASTYKVVGPEVFFPGGGGGDANARRQVQQRQNTPSGLVPPDCLVKNANWCASALPKYSDETGCWAAADACWEQLDECYESAPPSGSKGCKVWEEQMCTVVSDGCESGDVQGPPAAEGLGEDVNEPIPGGRLPDAVNGGGQAAKGRNRAQRAAEWYK
ncbi:glycoside hydrolase family 61 protein [Chaetomium fimeti]|uniref:lytic cellulose monooxygenase (C4-dehydrogenating) n=1 Tax=Chaetomium fimeti TaxID=1854472 RepID=A0AAE0LNW5_9PEZI|nr:glycoside hydrolase family 61 protein [Chaetomium fimeti]